MPRFMTMNNENEKRIKEKIEFFISEKVIVHVELVDRTFLNGLIEKEIKQNVYWIIDNKLGGVYLFLKDIYDVDTFIEKGEVK